MSIADVLTDRIHERGPLTVAAFMELALYDPAFGYYTRAVKRSGRAGDFFTSVDVGPLFGELLEMQLADMHGILAGLSLQPSALRSQPTSLSHPLLAISPQPSAIRAPSPQTPALADPPMAISHQPSAIPPVAAFDLVEAAAGNGRLSADILRAARTRDPAFYDALRLHLVEVSHEARRAQQDALADVGDRLASSGPDLPDSFDGALVANELLDAMPVHQVVMRDDGLREVYVDVARRAGHHHGAETPPLSLVTIDGPPSTPDLQGYLDRLGITLEPGWRGEINLAAITWMREAARRIRRGFIILIDYGHEARHLYTASRAGGTLTTYARHHSDGPESGSATPPWLQHPGERDITSHVDFTSVRAAAEEAGLTTLGFLDQTYFILGLLGDEGGRDFFPDAPDTNAARHTALALRTLMMPGGLGSTHKVLLLGKGVGRPVLRGCSSRVRVT